MTNNTYQEQRAVEAKEEADDAHAAEIIKAIETAVEMSHPHNTHKDRIRYCLHLTQGHVALAIHSCADKAMIMHILTVRGLTTRETSNAHNTYIVTAPAGWHYHNHSFIFDPM